MRYVVLAVSAGLAWFLLVSVAVSTAVALAVRMAAARSWLRFGEAPSTIWLGLRLLPALTAVLFVVTVFGPAFVRFEPRAVSEPVSAGLAILAALSLVLASRALHKALAGWRQAVRHAHAWMRSAERLPDSGDALDVRVVNASEPAVSLVGLWRPRLFVSRAVIEALTVEELRVVIAHERGHRSAWDNLKRLAVLAAPDVLGPLGTGAVLEGRWVRAVEWEADRHAVRGDAANGLNLASALIKVARLMPVASPLTAPVSNFYNGGSLAARVGRLANPQPEPRRRSLVSWLALAAAPLAWWGATSAPMLKTVHHLTELLVRFAG